MRIKLTQDKNAIVDDDMYEVLNQVKWYASKEGNFFYARKHINIDRKRIPLCMHHCIVGFPLNNKEVDHISGDGLDNRRSNLRIVSRRENLSNRRDRRELKTTSKYVGVCWKESSHKWQAKIRLNKKQIHLGYFKDEAKAGQAYQEALVKILDNQ